MCHWRFIFLHSLWTWVHILVSNCMKLFSDIKTKSLNLFFSVINTMDYEKVIVNKSSTHLITWKFFVVFIRPRNRTISIAKWIQRTYLTPVFRVNFNLILLRSPTSFKLSRPSAFCQHFSSFMRTTSLAHLTVIYFMLLKVFSEAYKLWSSTLYSFIQPVIYSVPLCLNMLICKMVLKQHQFVLLPQGNNTKMQIHTKNTKL